MKEDRKERKDQRIQVNLYSGEEEWNIIQLYYYKAITSQAGWKQGSLLCCHISFAQNSLFQLTGPTPHSTHVVSSVAAISFPESIFLSLPQLIELVVGIHGLGQWQSFFRMVFINVDLKKQNTCALRSHFSPREENPSAQRSREGTLAMSKTMDQIIAEVSLFLFPFHSVIIQS